MQLRDETMVSCKQNAIKVIRAMDQKLTLSERLMMKVHMMMCNSCRLFARQMHSLDDVLKQHSAAVIEESNNTTQALSEQARQRIRATIQQQLPGPNRKR